DQPDAVPDHSHLVHDLPRRRGALPVRRGGAPRLRLRARDRRDHGDLLLHRSRLARDGLGVLESCALTHIAKGTGQGILVNSEGGSAPLPNLPPETACAGEAGARNGNTSSPLNSRGTGLSDRLLGRGPSAPKKLVAK